MQNTNATHGPTENDQLVFLAKALRDFIRAQLREMNESYEILLREYHRVPNCDFKISYTLLVNRRSEIEGYQQAYIRMTQFLSDHGLL